MIETIQKLALLVGRPGKNRGPCKLNARNHILAVPIGEQILDTIPSYQCSPNLYCDPFSPRFPPGFSSHSYTLERSSRLSRLGLSRLPLNLREPIASAALSI